MIQENSKILSNTNVAPGYFRMGIECRKGISDSRPGQFITLGIKGQVEPLLRRPFSIHRLVRHGSEVIGVEVLYRVAGRYTRKISELNEGQLIDFLGPLGRGFDIIDELQSVVIVAGGIGVAPMVFLAEALSAASLECSVLIGGRTSDDILCLDDFKALGMRLDLSTDDGSMGSKGLVTRRLQNFLQGKKPDMIFACGPMPMLEAVASLADSKKVSCQISIETIMACGVGACMGCAVQARDNSQEAYPHACKDGPVFYSNSIF